MKEQTLTAPGIEYFETPTGDPLMREVELTVVKGKLAYKFTLPRNVWLELHDLIFDKGCQSVVKDVNSALSLY